MKPGQEAATSPYRSSRRMRAVSSRSGSMPRSDAYAGTTAGVSAGGIAGDTDGSAGCIADKLIGLIIDDNAMSGKHPTDECPCFRLPSSEGVLLTASRVKSFGIEWSKRHG